MARTLGVIDTKMHNADIGGDWSGGESSGSASSSLLEQWDRPLKDLYNLGEEEQTELQRRSVGPKYLICLTVGTGGLQVIWTAIMGQGSPYLSSLRLPPYVISLIWLTGPLSGAFVQPYVSVLSDRSRHPWGQRKPYILLGTIFAIICMLLLPWTDDFISYLFCSFGNDHKSTATLVLSGIVAGSLILALNVAIQPLQMGIRTLIVEACPPHQQVQAAAFASCITGIGSIFGYASGFVKLPQLLPWLGDTQFKCVCVVASVALGLTVAVSLSVIKDKKVVFDDEEMTGVGLVDVFRQVLRSVTCMPKDMKRVYKVQFFAWLGWFPFLFYITT